MDRLPIFLKLTDQRCLVVGGGVVAARKIRLLARAGADITVVAPELCSEVVDQEGKYTHVAGEYSADHLHDQRLVIAATDVEALNKQVASDAAARGVLCNVVDDDDASAFTMPAIVDRSPVIIAIGTEGTAPVLAQQLKSQIESWLPASIGALASYAGRLRPLVKKRFGTLLGRRRFWQDFFTGPIRESLIAGNVKDADKMVRQRLIQDADLSPSLYGEGWLVGAGPGDPELMTLRAQQLLSRADVILYDRLISPAILEYARKDADLIDVGKRVGGGGYTQSEINELLVSKVAAGLRVCRLKGGDPFVFGRGGEEAAALARANLPFQVVPGITAALGGAALAGIPLTHRGVSSSVTLATARLENGAAADWARLLAAGETLAIYMGVGAIADIRAALLDSGASPETPAAFVENATRPEQRTVLATVGTLAADAKEFAIQSPSMLYIGEAVRCAEELSWFEERRLSQAADAAAQSYG